MPAAALAALIPSAFQAVAGITQMNRGKRLLEGLQRPEYDIPDAEKQSLAIANAAYQDPKMPGENVAYSRIGQTLSQFLRASRDNGNPMAGLAMAQANSNRAYNDLASQSAMHQEADRRDLMNNLETYAQYQDQKWQMNKYAPYADKYQEGRQLVGGGAQNVNTALQGLSSVALQGLMGKVAPVSAGQIADARTSAAAAQGQDSFISSAGKMIGKGAMETVNGIAPGMSPQQLMQAISNFYRTQ